MDFSGHAGQGGQSFDLIPAKTLAFAVLKFGGYGSNRSNQRYMSWELTVTDEIGAHPFSGRKIWVGHMVDPSAHAADEKAQKSVEIAGGQITRILETRFWFSAGRQFDEQAMRSAGGYAIPDDAQGRPRIDLLDNSLVAIRVGIEPGRDGYSDKNKVQEWLTPHPSSATHKDFQRLLAGEFGIPAGAGPAQGSLFGGSGVSNHAAAQSAAGTALGNAIQPSSGSQASPAAPGDAAPNWLSQMNNGQEQAEPLDDGIPF